jgi:transcriptional regulator with XRE-family HTH domain
LSLTIGKNISKLIKHAGYESLGQLYKDSMVSVATLSRIVNDIQKPTPATLKKLAPWFKGVI